MRAPKRVLGKMLAPETDLDPFESTGESLETLIELLRQVQKCRKIRKYFLKEFGFDMAVSPDVFDALLEIPQVNLVETPNRDGEFDRSAFKDQRNPDDPVSFSNLNAVLREINRDLGQVEEKMNSQYPDLLLSADINAGLVDQLAVWVNDMCGLNRKYTGYIFTWGKIKKIEEEFSQAFPQSVKAKPLMENRRRVKQELKFYRYCLNLNSRWGALGLDFLQFIRADGAPQVIENVQEMGNALWNIIYSCPRLKNSISLVGISFNDVRTIFENEKINSS